MALGVGQELRQGWCWSLGWPRGHGWENCSLSDGMRSQPTVILVWIEKQPQPLWSGKAPAYLKSASSRRSTPVLPEWAEFHRPGAEGIVLGGTSGQPRVRAFPLIREEAGLAGILSDGLEGGGAHSLRHTYARKFLEGFGATLAQLSAALGHSSLAVTERYKHMSRNTMSDALAALVGRPAPVPVGPSWPLEAVRNQGMGPQIGPSETFYEKFKEA